MIEVFFCKLIVCDLDSIKTPQGEISTLPGVIVLVAEAKEIIALQVQCTYYLVLSVLEIIANIFY